MIVFFHKRFTKRYGTLSSRERLRCDTQLRLFMREPFHSTLNNHPLHGVYREYRSINIGGDLRAIYKMIDKKHVLFAHIGTHAELYE